MPVMAKRDYYEVLGVGRGASEAEHDRVVGETVVSEASRHLTGQHRADSAVHVPDRQLRADALAAAARSSRRSSRTSSRAARPPRALQPRNPENRAREVVGRSRGASQQTSRLALCRIATAQVPRCGRRIAENTPIQLKAAQETELRARVRYENGLTNVTEVAEAQRLLAQAEIDNSVARLGVWRALLAAARSSGDLKPFLEQVTNAAKRK